MKIIKKIDLNVKHIVHIADVHIRNVRRHVEYEQVFSRMYDKIKELKEDHRDLVIYLGGDIVHGKIDMSPELISVTYKFLKSCADIAPTFLILGNHDCNLNNKSRLDALSPIVESLNHPNLFFFKDTGIYRTNNVDFVLWSITDDVKNYSKPPKGKNKQILFYHGAVNNAITEQGIQIKNNKLTVDSISGFDYVLLGDIHRYQYLDENKTVCYCGSTVQQDFGESLSHGFVFWNIETGFSKFIDIKNDYGFYTLEAKKGKWVKNTMPSTFCKHPNIRVKAYDTNHSDMTKLITALKTTVNVNEIKISKINTKPDLISTKVVKTGDIRDIEYQNQLILGFLEKTMIVDSNLKNQIFDINRQLNTNIDLARTIKNITWIPVKFEFSNMFSYGEDNEINFSDMEGIYGLFASNASGKSSILDSLMFCIFDKCSRTFKASQVLNNKKDNFKCKFEFEIHGKRYFIERIGTKDKKEHVKVDVNFWTEENGSRVSLNGIDRENTNSIIRDYLGNYDEFILTTMSLQNNSSNFVDKAQRERKDILSQFLDLNVFEELTQMANTEVNQIKAVIKEFSKQDYPSKIANASNEKKTANEMVKVTSLEKNKVTAKINELTDEILNLSKSVKQIDDTLLNLDGDSLLNKKEELKIKIKKCEEKINDLNSNKNQFEKKYDAINLNITDIDLIKLKENAQKEQVYNDNNYIYKRKLETLSIELSHIIQKVDKLNTHEYDPDCKYCIENEFVKDAIQAKKDLIFLQNDKVEIESLIKENDIENQKYIGSINLLNEYESYKTELLKLKAEILDIEAKINEFSLFKINVLNAITELENKIQSYNDNKQAIESNKTISLEIDIKQTEKNELTLKLHQIDEALSNHTAQVKISDSILKDAKEKISYLNSLEEKFKAYELYAKATNRNGVPYDLISEILPQIENEANEILSYLVDFKILLDTDGKSINIYIMYDESKIWALELASGMEKFISAIAIRNALINYSNLPRPNFIAIDEGFGVLDGENMAALYNIFQYLKTQYKFILIISHIDTLKDMAENQIEIYKNEGFSKVIF